MARLNRRISIFPPATARSLLAFVVINGFVLLWRLLTRPSGKTARAKPAASPRFDTSGKDVSDGVFREVRDN